MAYEVTATRKRPQSFDEMAGQEFVVSTLKSSIEQGRIAHAYLFSGPRGVGKTSAARILARSLNCDQGPTATPCGQCTACQEVARGNSLDVIEIDGASNTSVNDVREIKDEVLFAPNSSRYKIYIIDEVHMLSNSAFNALLKTIEEPPPYIVFIFATTEIHKVPATIRSRCQQFNFRLFSLDTIRGLLHQVCSEVGIEAEEDALFWIAKEATGSMRDAYTLFDQVVSFAGERITLGLIQEKLGLAGFDALGEVVGAMARSEGPRVLELAGETLDRGVSIEQYLADLTEYFRSLLFIKHGIRRESLIGYPLDRFDPEALERFSTTQLEQAIELLLELYRNIRFSLNQRFELDLVLSRLASLGAYVSPSEILDQIQSIRAEMGGGRPSGTSPRPHGGDPRTGSSPGGASAGRSPAGSSNDEEPAQFIRRPDQALRERATEANREARSNDPQATAAHAATEHPAPPTAEAEAPSVPDRSPGAPDPAAGSAAARDESPAPPARPAPSADAPTHPTVAAGPRPDPTVAAAPRSEPAAPAPAPAVADSPPADPTPADPTPADQPSEPSLAGSAYDNPPGRADGLDDEPYGDAEEWESGDEESVPERASDQLRREVVAGLRKTKLNLSSALEKALSWEYDGETLTLAFDNAFSATLVRDETATVAERVADLLGRSVRVVVTTTQEEAAESEPEHEGDEQVELVKKIFRGEVIQGGDT